MKKYIILITIIISSITFITMTYAGDCNLKVAAKDAKTGKLIYNYTGKLYEGGEKGNNLGEHSAYRWSNGNIYWSNVDCDEVTLKVNAKGYDPTTVSTKLGQEGKDKVIIVELEQD
jgi:hypothetical protein